MRFVKWLAVVLVLGVLAGIAVPALAAPPFSPFAFKSIFLTSCEPYGSIGVEFAAYAYSGPISYQYGITNLRTGAAVSASFTGNANIPSVDPEFEYLEEMVPPGTRPGDMLEAWINGTLSGDRTFSTSIAFDCSTGLPWTPSVAPVTASEAAPFLAVPGPGGAQACGVFNVLGHGPKIIPMSQFPNCTGPASKYTVYCFTDHATWANQYISDLGVDEDGNLTFTSGQHGHCALFPAP